MADPDGVPNSGDEKKVHFSQGNLYWNGSAFKFEANQYSGTSYANNHVSHFYWSKDASVAYAESYSDNSKSADVFFTNATEETAKADFTVNGETGQYRTLSSAEWTYLFNNHVTVWGQCNSVNGYFIAPDGYEGDATALTSAVTNWASAEAAGIVFLPAAGYRYGSNVGFVGDSGDYWSSTAYDSSRAYYVFFNSDNIYPVSNIERNYGFSVRLITDVK